MSEENYSIKEMLAEFRKDVAENFKDVNNHLLNIDNKQGIANGRTGKIEGKQKAYILVVSVVWTLTLAVGGVFARLYVADIARAVAEEQKSAIIKEVNIETQKTIVEILKNYQ
jgi:hypothetical protein